MTAEVAKKFLQCIWGMEIPIWILFFALGASSDKEVVKLIDVDVEDGRTVNIIIASIHHADKECVSLGLGFKQKARVLAYEMPLAGFVEMLIIGMISETRLEHEVKVHLKHAEKHMVKTMQRDLYKYNMEFIERYLDSSIITYGLSRAFSTGTWSHPYFRGERISGLVANFGRTNPLQMIAEMRRTRQHVDYTGRVGDARYP
ncbi:hypothetical protein POM88_051378 [Heracleum sosnowskyi]|uniref:DNA-directed RNA polymerase n=1 Tax=Heracleum sosnowskyi TaxID=360622 RepID=A0AAD8H1R2_9APIA|nr:hypothetical protein POM88_051378 [Heracleum sosnowskyi]